jgi:hypothetical protein
MELFIYLVGWLHTKQGMLVPVEILIKQSRSLLWNILDCRHHHVRGKLSVARRDCNIKCRKNFCVISSHSAHVTGISQSTR